ncbi:MAG: histidinol dehydrogenase [Candidatus Nanopelagicaceae bacterium]
MIRRVDLRGMSSQLSRQLIRREIPRAMVSIDSVMDDVKSIIMEVANGDEKAILELGRRFDSIAPKSIRVPEEVITKALRDLDPKVKAALSLSIERIRKVHEVQRRSDSTVEVAAGATVEERWVPVDRVALYVPGGRAVYPSSVMMNVIPAQIAGVPSIAILSPAQSENDGWPHPTILATAALLDIEEIYALGGAIAVAAAAYGVRDSAGKVIMEPADMVTGPGNIYVAAAKRALRGIIGIDSEAGPTEIAIIADDQADPKTVAADLISQAEHDTIAAAVLITDSPALADDVIRDLGVSVEATKHRDRIREALGGIQSAVVLVDSLDDAVTVANHYAAEHLEIQTSDEGKWASKIRNAGAVFLGRYTPVSLGDYSAGSNHVLPTGGCACHSSGLSVQSFLRGLHFVRYEKSALQEVADAVVTLAEAENLPAHGQAIRVRFDD